MPSPTAARLLLSDGITLAQDGLLQLFPEGYRWIDSLADLPREVPADVSARGVVLVLTPEQAREMLRRPPPSAKYVIVLWLGAGDATLARTLLHNPQVAGVLDEACSPATVYTVLKSALALAEKQVLTSAEQMLEQVLNVGRALASEKDLDTLLQLILTHARSLTGADGASIYTFDADERLCFRLWQTGSPNPPQGGESDRSASAVGEDSVAGFVARDGKLLALADAYAIPAEAPYRFNKNYDQAAGYRTRSLLTVPLKNKADHVIGVLQLINRKVRADARLETAADVDTQVVPFSQQDQTIALALAGQAGVALENSALYADIEKLLDGFIGASVGAIEARDPITAGHSFRVADFTEGLAKAVDRSERGALRAVQFDRAGLRELRYAALLHDFGKVGVREEVLRKSKKLYPLQMELVRQRFKYARSQLQLAMYRRLLDEQQQHGYSAQALQAARAAAEQALDDELARLRRYWDSVLCANEPTVMPLAVSADLAAVAAYEFWDDEEQRRRRLLEPFEFADLSLAKGNLSREERGQIESHVTHTYTFLNTIPWTHDLRQLPEITYAHHEKLDGSGYPRGLAAAAIPLQAKIMAIADIYDALTAGDRPYKAAVPIPQALDILKGEARQHKLDSDLVDIFVESGAYRLHG